MHTCSYIFLTDQFYVQGRASWGKWSLESLVFRCVRGLCNGGVSRSSGYWSVWNKRSSSIFSLITTIVFTSFTWFTGSPSAPIPSWRSVLRSTSRKNWRIPSWLRMLWSFHALTSFGTAVRCSRKCFPSLISSALPRWSRRSAPRMV